MELRIRINDKTVFVLLIVAALVSAVGITLAQVPNPGHPWSQIECVNCIATGNLADDSVTSAKIVDGQVQNADLGSDAVTTDKIADGQVQTADIGDSQVTNAKIADSEVTDEKINDVTWGKVTGEPAWMGGSCPSCGTCWETEAVGPCTATYYRICTPSGWKATSFSVYTCPYCPFIYSWNGREYVLETTILYKLDSEDKEAVQYRGLQYLDTGSQVRAKIAEREHETSYIDRIQIVVTDSANGEEEVTVLNPVSASRGLSLISESDDSYLVMEYGDEVYVEFEQAPELKDGFSRSVEVRAEGYYIFQ
jgi:hypothetical protein